MQATARAAVRIDQNCNGKKRKEERRGLMEKENRRKDEKPVILCAVPSAPSCRPCPHTHVNGTTLYIKMKTK
ncbi:hypothetical protein, unlikely [Trypanosoma brucei brucei TREU927]|uniref:Uncharacterized protein n=1 Tax=Trypanosoma brucei brucei (strain 927/4 GUTat10.1) TaxID=185431 RepID=Q38EY9_TRYB2|nr:hypothetical protein, unlikely [Trypanosoma brucei brucei TREU927]EAN76631.1 hypothetical protein, unlikely [Trypanosoma brucei brucei TREU927]